MPPLPHLSQRLYTALVDILPNGLASAVAQIEDELPFGYPEEAALREKASPARQQEFIGGRSCARAALAELGQAACPILADQHGAPVWPKGTLGSITHSKGLCCAVAAKAAHYKAIGVDLERTNRLSVAAGKHVVHPREMLFVDDDQVRASILFSLKEAFFKAQFPVFGAQPRFRDVCFEVDWGVSTARIVSIEETLPEALRMAALTMHFTYALFGEYVVCVAWLLC